MFFITMDKTQLKRTVIIVAIILVAILFFCLRGTCSSASENAPSTSDVSPSHISESGDKELLAYIAPVSNSEQLETDTLGMSAGSEPEFIPANVRLERLVVGEVVAKPLTSASISSVFGYRTHPITGVNAFHSGLDLAAAEGTEINAVLAGTVVSAQYADGYGNFVLLRHGDGLETLYAHCSALLVEPEDTVSRGQVIALVGSTGSATGAHLHIEFRLNGQRFDPKWILGELYD